MALIAKTKPTASCLTCGREAKVVKQHTFSFWFCDSCKDEKSVSFNGLTYCPKGYKNEYAPKDPNDLVINKPGVYRITYLYSDDIEFYEHSRGSSALTLNGASVQSATRIADDDLPPRNKVYKP